MIPPQANAAFVCAMEDVLAVYTRPDDPRRLQGFLEETTTPLVAETREPIPAPTALRLIAVYLEASGHAGDLHGPLFRPVKNNVTKPLAKPLSPTAVYQDIVKRYAHETGIADVVHGISVHSLHATAATNALAHAADIAEVQK